MPGPQNTLLVEGTFKELAEELADYIDNLRKSLSQADAASLRNEINPLLEAYEALEKDGDNDPESDDLEDKRDAVLKPIVSSSGTLNFAPDKEFIPAFNLLIYLVHQSQNINPYLQRICRNITSGEGVPSTLTAASGVRFSLMVSVLTTIFNTLDPDDGIRYPVFSSILDIVARSGSFDSLQPHLKHLEGWFSLWKVNASQQRKMYQKVSGLANDAGENQQGYEYLVRALRTIPSSDAAGTEGKDLSAQALRIALNSPTHFDFEDLTSLDSIQALRQSEPVYFQILELFTSDTLEDFNNFKEEHPGWIEAQKLDESVLVRKIRLLTLASLAASSGQARSLPYDTISTALQIPREEVEMWVIDVIRAGLVEGKLSQVNQTFLIHRSTYRVFSENQWREVAGRLDMWRTSLTGVLEVIRAEKGNVISQKEMELREASAKINGTGGGGGYRRNRNEVIEAMD